MSNADASNNELTYKKAGVDIERANSLVNNIKKIAQKTRRNGVLQGIGGFGALFEIPSHYKQPVLVSGTDGVGTKLKLAIELKDYTNIGIDLVAMCANDIVTLGAEPLFFLDYYATGHLDIEQASTIMDSIGKGCQEAGCALIGGETAELPGLYHEQDFDLAGFCVGAIEKSNIIDGLKVEAGDAIIAVASNGIHANGYSLVRKVLQTHNIKLNSPFENSTLGKELLKPTRLYIKPILKLAQAFDIRAIAHITGGGLIENIPRVLPDYHHAQLDLNSWQIPSLFQWLQRKGNIVFNEMMQTFNMGVGMVIVVKSAQSQAAIQQLIQDGEKAWQIGHIEKFPDQTQPTVILK